jgi:hypothetical protein
MSVAEGCHAAAVLYLCHVSLQFMFLGQGRGGGGLNLGVDHGGGETAPTSAVVRTVLALGSEVSLYIPLVTASRVAHHTQWLGSSVTVAVGMQAGGCQRVCLLLCDLTHPPLAAERLNRNVLWRAAVAAGGGRHGRGLSLAASKRPGEGCRGGGHAAYALGLMACMSVPVC